MAKKKKQKEEEVIEQKPLEIMSAKLRDGYCDYSYEVRTGVGIGDVHNVKGSGIIDDDLSEAFTRFNAHLAVMDEVFKHSGIDIDNIDDLHGNPLTDNYRVIGFAIKGSKENESIILTGTKYSMTAGEHLEIKTPKVTITGNCFYKWYNELKEAADRVRNEVELYRNGKCTAPEAEESNPNQLTIESSEAEVDFEANRVD